jgi:predicted RNA binding protein YcfA (HicA-like mRNA interferase family)
MNSREVIAKLKREGFEAVSQRGSHVKMRHSDGRCTVVPHPKKDLPAGTVKAIERQTGVTF